MKDIFYILDGIIMVVGTLNLLYLIMVINLILPFEHNIMELGEIGMVQHYLNLLITLLVMVD